MYTWGRGSSRAILKRRCIKSEIFQLLVFERGGNIKEFANRREIMRIYEDLEEDLLGFKRLSVVAQCGRRGIDIDKIISKI